MTENWQLPLRLAALGFFGVIVQIAAVSQITVFGVSVDLAPLLVAAVGLLVGSLPGAIFGFAVGLFVDLALVQDLGVTSLLFIVIGYAAGRLRELRDPAHGLVPVIVGAVATAISTVGFALMQFLLGIEAPVSWLLLRQVLVAVLLGALFALPVFALVRRVVSGALPDDPRRRRRRAYTTGGLSPLSRPSQGGR